MEKTITITSTKGLHAQLANKLVQITNKLDVDMKLVYQNVVVDAKSILGLMSLAVPQGKNVQLIAKGSDAEKAVLEIENILR